MDICEFHLFTADHSPFFFFDKLKVLNLESITQSNPPLSSSSNKFICDINELVNFSLHKLVYAFHDSRNYTNSGGCTKTIIVDKQQDE